MLRRTERGMVANDGKEIFQRDAGCIIYEHKTSALIEASHDGRCLSLAERVVRTDQHRLRRQLPAIGLASTPQGGDSPQDDILDVTSTSQELATGPQRREK